MDDSAFVRYDSLNWPSNPILHRHQNGCKYHNYRQQETKSWREPSQISKTPAIPCCCWVRMRTSWLKTAEFLVYIVFVLFFLWKVGLNIAKNILLISRIHINRFDKYGTLPSSHFAATTRPLTTVPKSLYAFAARDLCIVLLHIS